MTIEDARYCMSQAMNGLLRQRMPVVYRGAMFLQTKKNLKTIHARNSRGGGQVGCQKRIKGIMGQN